MDNITKTVVEAMKGGMDREAMLGRVNMVFDLMEELRGAPPKSRMVLTVKADDGENIPVPPAHAVGKRGYKRMFCTTHNKWTDKVEFLNGKAIHGGRRGCGTELLTPRQYKQWRGARATMG